ncbi:SDR family oxidoreductase [Joostella sp.]|uniref:SDR family oxidoreductase n=1 Tax=Joostella sp. TaxID=2231138 RepID=UPI003A8E858B
MVYSFDLNSKIILISGGYGYLGTAIVESLLFHNAIVYILGRSESKFEALLSSVGCDNKEKLFFEECDISSTDSIKKAYDRIFYREGKIDVLINNAFYSMGQSPEQMTDEEWKVGIDGTLSSVFRCIREITPYFKEKKNGKIINVSSMYGMVSPDFDVYIEFPEFLNPPHYGAAKAGVIQLSKYYASYLGEYGVNVNSVTPGPFPSRNVQKNTKFIDSLKRKTLLNKIGKPEDLAGIFVFLASDTSNYVTGQNMIIDGGWTTK